MAQERKRRRFTAEYKAEAVKRLEESGKALQQVAAELGVHANQLRTWRHERLAAGSGARQVVGVAQDVLAADLVVEQVEAERRLVLRLEIELPLKLPDTVRCCQAHRQSPILGFVASAPEVRVLPSADITRHRRYYDPVRPPPASPSGTTSRARPSCSGGSPQLPASPFRRAVPTTPVDRGGCVRRLLPRHVQPSPKFRRCGVHDFAFEACSGFTRVTARRIARPPEAAFVTRLQLARLPGQAARQLPDQTDNYPGGTFLHW